MYVVVFDCEKFNQFIYGKHTIIETEHKPLQSIIKKPLSQAPIRIQRLLLRLDALPRAYVSTRYPVVEELDDEMDFYVHSINSSVQVSKSKFDAFKDATVADITLQEIRKAIRYGWSGSREQVHNEIKSIWNYRAQIHEMDGVLLFPRGEVPENLKKSMLPLMHEVHLGMQKSLYRARQGLLWPEMTQDVKGMVETVPNASNIEENS